VARRRNPTERLATPAAADARRLAPPFSPDTFGRFAEGVARYLGTAKYLIIQTVVIVVWIAFNLGVYTFDKYPFILLTLALSMQASYAAPLILLAQNRQEDRDREALERDRDEARRTQQDTEYLARELASIRIALNDVVTGDDLERSIERVIEATGGPRRKAKKKKHLSGGDAAQETEPGGGPSDTPEPDDADEPASPS
jgi:uncharacterized membrane protein